MNRIQFALLNLILCFTSAAAEVRIYETNVLVETMAGSGFPGLIDGQGTLTMFNNPQSLAIDSQTNVFVWDSGNYRIRKIRNDGLVTTVWTNAEFSSVFGMTALPDDSLLVIDGSRLRRISPAGQVTNIPASFTGNGYLDGPIDNAQFSLSGGRLAADPYGTVYVSDAGNRRVRVISTNWIVSTLAGAGCCGAVDGVGIFSSFNAVYGITVDPFGNTYVLDYPTLLRKISPSGVVSTLAGKRGDYLVDALGTNAVLDGLEMASDAAGNLYVTGPSRVRRITPEGAVTTLCGGNFGYLDGEGSVARFGVELTGIAVDRAGRIWVSDKQNQRIRRITYSPLPLTGFGIALYPGLSVTGRLGKSFRIEYSDSISAPQAWTPVTTVTLTNSPTLWFDTSGTKPRRFYRSVELP